ncbi:MAG: NAD(+) synthase [Methanomassiliicoccaceae archaeon]|nr:NAD(+) synthase [Methanomassiliicoccaceae archaeon]
MFDAKETKRQMVEWVRGYFRDNGSPLTKAVIGISGGKDSSVVAALCVEALGRDRVLGVLLPQGEQEDIDVAFDLCEALGLEHVVINIEDSVRGLYGEVGAAGLALNDVAVFNTPARIRMAALYAVSGIVGGRVANTCNLSEDWVGYVTKFGDSAGDFCPLSDLTASEVKAIGRELGLAPRFMDKVPMDGLCGKTDEESFGFTYDVLDRYLREGVCEDEGVKERIDRLHRLGLHKMMPLPAFRLCRQGAD